MNKASKNSSGVHPKTFYQAYAQRFSTCPKMTNADSITNFPSASKDTNTYTLLRAKSSDKFQRDVLIKSNGTSTIIIVKNTHKGLESDPNNNNTKFEKSSYFEFDSHCEKLHHYKEHYAGIKSDHELAKVSTQHNITAEAKDCGIANSIAKEVDEKVIGKYCGPKKSMFTGVALLEETEKTCPSFIHIECKESPGSIKTSNYDKKDFKYEYFQRKHERIKEVCRNYDIVAKEPEKSKFPSFNRVKKSNVSPN